jgi:hypothetical protein
MDAINDTTTALLELTESLTPDEPREQLLDRVSSQVLQLVSGADGVTVTLAETGHASTIAATDPALVTLDEAQYRADNGPCLEALRTQTMVRADLGQARQRWPAFADTAATVGIAVVLSCPLFMPADNPIAHRQAHSHDLSGALNIWSFDPTAFDPAETTLTVMFTSAVSAVILTAARWARAHAQAQQLQHALESRDAIATAKGIVMVRRNLSRDAAFVWLTDVSQQTNIKIRDFVDLIINNPDTVGTVP